MRRATRPLVAALALTAILAACGGSGTEPTAKPKPDPYITIHTRPNLDTTTAAGRASWVRFILLSGPYVNQNGVGYQGTVSGAREQGATAGLNCSRIGADSIGQRYVTMLALADTTIAGSLTTGTDYHTADSLAHQWWSGHRALPAGWMALATDSIDAWNSQQYAAGHGLTTMDPIRWQWNWTTGTGGAVAHDFVESPTDTTCNWGQRS